MTAARRKPDARERLLELVGADAPPLGRSTKDWERHRRTMLAALRAHERALLSGAADRAASAFAQSHPNYLPHVAGAVRAAIQREGRRTK